jgi:hypothetical protein
MRRCSRCLRELSEEEFDAYTYTTRLRAHCKECSRILARLSYYRRSKNVVRPPEVAEAVGKMLAEEDERRRTRLQAKLDRFQVVDPPDVVEVLEAAMNRDYELILNRGRYASDGNWLCFKGQRRFPSRALEETLASFWAEFLENVPEGG